MTIPTAPPRTPIPSDDPSTSRVSKYDLLQTIFDPSRLLVFPHPNPGAAVQTYLASLDAVHSYWNGVLSLPDYLLSIGVRKERTEELAEVLGEHPGLLRHISVEMWVMGFLEQDEGEDEKAYQEWVEADRKRQQKNDNSGMRMSEDKELAGTLGETDPAASAIAGIAAVVV